MAHHLINAPSPSTQRRAHYALVLVLLCALLTACGFRLKGTASLPFQTLYTNISPDTAFGAHLRRVVAASSSATRWVDDPQQAQAQLIQLDNRRALRELSIDASGHVEEYELIIDFVFQLNDGRGNLLLGPITLRSLRELPYNPDEAQAKEREIERIFADMELSLVDRIMRRLSASDVQDAWRQSQDQQDNLSQ